MACSKYTPMGPNYFLTSTKTPTLYYSLTHNLRLDELPNRINIKGKKKCPFSYITLYALGLGLQI